MANYDPPQPLWKRRAAGILDFLLVTTVFGVPLFKLFATSPTPQPGTYLAENNIKIVGLTGWASWLLIALIIGYFVVLGRTGGTVFQRAFRMKRAEKSSSNQTELLSKERDGKSSPQKARPAPKPDRSTHLACYGKGGC
jgi:hypothetical protein